MSQTPLDKLASLFEEFPGIGRRQARRFAYFIARKENGFVSELAHSMKHIRQSVKQCPISFQYFFEDGIDDRAPIERDPSRDNAHLMIVEKDTDIESMERSGVFKGKYFIIGNLASLLDTEISTNKRMQSLKSRIEHALKEGVLKEITLALPAHPEGDRTALLVRQSIESIIEGSPVIITELGRGISTGTELEYADRHTLEEAWKNRH